MYVCILCCLINSITKYDINYTYLFFIFCCSSYHHSRPQKNHTELARRQRQTTQRQTGSPNRRQGAVPRKPTPKLVYSQSLFLYFLRYFAYTFAVNIIVYIIILVCCLIIAVLYYCTKNKHNYYCLITHNLATQNTLNRYGQKKDNSHT